MWPYPSDETKSELIAKTNLDATQVNNWFINFRKRHWIKLSVKDSNLETRMSPPGRSRARSEGLWKRR